VLAVRVDIGLKVTKNTRRVLHLVDDERGAEALEKALAGLLGLAGK